MTFNEILTKKFEVKQKRIKKLRIKNDSNIDTLDFLGNCGLFFSLCFSILIPFFLDFGFINLIFGVIFFFIFAFISFIPLMKNFEKTEKLDKKIKSEKYNIFLEKTQYSIVFDKIKNCNFEEFKDNKNIILKYIKNLPLKQQEEAIEIMNRKIDLHENGLQKIEERIDNSTSFNTAHRNNNVLKSI